MITKVRTQIFSSTSVFALIGIGLTACGSSVDYVGGNPTPAPASGVQTTISGTLGGAISPLVMRSTALSSRLPEDPAIVIGYQPHTTLAGITVECMTLSSSPTSGSTVTDGGGNFSVSFATNGNPFSCYLTSPGASAVPLEFANATGTGTSTMLNATAGATVSLGTMAVSTDSTTGATIVTATIPTSTTTTLQTTTPPGLPCLQGVWNGTTTATCANFTGSPAVTLSLNIGQLADGTYIGGFTYGNALLPNGVQNASGATIPATSTCLPVANGFSQANLSVGMYAVANSSTDFPVGTKIAALPSLTDSTCPGGIVLSQATTNTSPDSSPYVEFFACGNTPAVNLTTVAYDSNASTMTIVHPDKCVMSGVAPYQSTAYGATTCAAGTNTITASLVSGSTCATITSSASIPSAFVNGDLITMPNGFNLPPAPAYLHTDTANFCTTGQVQLSAPATGTGSGTIAVGSDLGGGDFIGSYTSGSRCITPTGFESGIGANGHYVSDSGLITNNANVTFVTPTTCAGGGKFQLSAPVTFTGGPTFTVLMYDTSATPYAPFWATLTSGSACVIPAYVGDTTRIQGGGITVSTSDGFIAAGTKVVNASPCASTQLEMSNVANDSYSHSIVDGTHAAGSFQGNTTIGTTCVTPFADVYTGEFVTDQHGALPSGTTVVNGGAQICAPSQVNLSNAATATVSSTNVAVVPASALGSGGCYFTGSGPAFDRNGNGYWNGAGNNCSSLSSTAAQTAWTATEVIPVSTSCTNLWDVASTTCVSTPNGTNCGAASPPTFSANNYAKTETGCAACFPGVPGTGDGGCIGNGNVTCTSSAGSTANQILTKQ